jgi:hypothetical protein
MPEVFIPPSDPQDPGKPAGQAEGAEAPEQGDRPSSIQKLKTKLRDALESAEYWRNQSESLKGDMQSISQDVAELKKTRSPQSPEDYSEKELLNAALAPEADQTQALRAFMHYMNKRFSTIEEKFGEKVEGTIQDRFREQARQGVFQGELQKLVARYGEDNLRPGADLHTRASQYFQALREQVAEPDGSMTEPVKRLLEIRAVELAAQDLDIPKPAAPPPEGATLSAEDRLESGSDAVAQALDEAKELLKKGDVSGAIKKRVQAQFGVT